MTPNLTYGKLYAILGDLDFSHHEVEKEGKRNYLFEHSTSKNAFFFLPVRPQNENVELPFLRSVLATLKGHGLMGEADTLAMLTNNKNNTTGQHQPASTHS